MRVLPRWIQEPQARPNGLRRSFAALLVLSALAALAACLPGCGDRQTRPPPPPAAVTVSHPVQRQVTDWDEYTGYLASPQTANVAARVSGLIMSAPFAEGAFVHEGDVLFLIDPRPFQADVDNKAAAAAQAQAAAHQAEQHFERYHAASQTVTKDELQTAQAAAQQAKAALMAAKAAEELSQLNLQWTKVTAPISGRISRKLVTVGNLVNGGAGQPQVLTTIVSVDPLYCYVPVPSGTLLGYKSLLTQDRRREGMGNANLPCRLQVQNEKGFPHEGAIDFIDNAIDPGTGTIQVRGTFANSDQRLVPGLFARMRIPTSEPHEATLIPDAAIGTDQNERYVLLVGPDNIVQRRTVQPGRVFGTLRALPDGTVKIDERIIVEGIQQARPGETVTARLVPIPAAAFAALDQALLKSAPATRWSGIDPRERND